MIALFRQSSGLFLRLGLGLTNKKKKLKEEKKNPAAAAAAAAL